MKFYVSISEFFKRKTRNSSVESNASENISSEAAMKKVAANSSVVRFEDCVRINRERFVAVENSRLSSTNQFYAALSANILAFSVGISIGWASPSLQLLQSNESPLGYQITSPQASLISSLLPLGALFGTLLFGSLSDVVGRYWAFLLAALPETFSWLSIIFATTVEHLYIARFLTGLSTGGVFTLVPLYVSEISDLSIRGSLNSLFLLSVNAGTLLMFIVGTYIDYSTASNIMFSIPIAFIVTFLFFPETPYYLLKCSKNKKAENSLKFLRGCEKLNETPEKVKSELLSIAKKVEEDGMNKRISLIDELKMSTSRKALIIGIVLVVVNQLCGCFAFINYTAEIFAQSGSSLSPSVSAIIVAFIQLFGSVVSTLITERLTRKTLYVLSCCGTIFGLFTFGMHGFLSTLTDVSQFNWIPIVSMSFVIFIASVGLMPLTFTILSEILPLKIRSFGVSFCTALLWLIAFLLLIFFPAAVDAFELYVCMFAFCFITFVGMIFVIFIVPETKNRTIEEIERLLV